MPECKHWLSSIRFNFILFHFCSLARSLRLSLSILFLSRRLQRRIFPDFRFLRRSSILFVRYRRLRFFCLDSRLACLFFESNRADFFGLIFWVIIGENLGESVRKKNPILAWRARKRSSTLMDGSKWYKTNRKMQRNAPGENRGDICRIGESPQKMGGKRARYSIM